jgi:DNA polymerase III sliding clamp (beta) subunit (PCNA family)
MGRITKKLTISGTNMNIELHRSLNGTVIRKRSTIKKTLNVHTFLEIEALMCGGDLNSKKITKDQDQT